MNCPGVKIGLGTEQEGDNREDAAIERKINGRVLLWIWGRIPSRVPPRNVAMCFQCTTFGLRRLPRSPGSHSSSVSVFTRDMTKKDEVVKISYTNIKQFLYLLGKDK